MHPVGPHRDGVTSVELDNRFCLFSPDTDSVVVLNESASVVWGLIDRHRTEVDLIDELMVRFDAPRDAVEADVRATLDRFVDAGLIDPPLG